MVRCLAIVFILFACRLFGQPCPTINMSQTLTLDCMTSKGAMTIAPSAGTPPFTYVWSPNVSTSSVAANLNTGAYNFTITDVNGCLVVGFQNFNMSLFMNISFSLSPTNTISCFGANNGAITATVGGSSATPPYTYTWSNGNNSNSITNLSPGVYTLTAKDNAGCTTTNTYNVLEPADIYSKFSNSVTCYGTSINAVLSTTGGIAPFSYTVNGSAITGNTLTASGGTYTIITKDANGCIK